jgi:hypothetical protein
MPSDAATATRRDQGKQTKTDTSRVNHDRPSHEVSRAQLAAPDSTLTYRRRTLQFRLSVVF